MEGSFDVGGWFVRERLRGLRLLSVLGDIAGARNACRASTLRTESSKGENTGKGSSSGREAELPRNSTSDATTGVGPSQIKHPKTLTDLKDPTNSSKSTQNAINLLS